MPEYGFCCNVYKDLFSEIRAASRIKADYIEFHSSPPTMIDFYLKNGAKIRKALKESDLTCTFHMEYFVDLGSEVKIIRDAWIRESKRAIRAASSMGARKIVIHAHTSGMSIRFPKNKKNVIRNFVQAFNLLAPYANMRGVRIMVENDPFSKKGMGLADFVKIVRKVRGAGVCFDIGHANMSSEKGIIRKGIRMLGKSIEHVHIHDNNGMEDEHLPIGKGKIDFKMVARELRKANFQGTMTFEVFSGGQTAVRSSMRKFKKLLGN